MKKFIILIMLLISSFSYYGTLDENGNKITNIQEIIQTDEIENEPKKEVESVSIQENESGNITESETTNAAEEIKEIPKKEVETAKEIKKIEEKQEEKVEVKQTEIKVPEKKVEEKIQQEVKKEEKQPEQQVDKTIEQTEEKVQQEIKQEKVVEEKKKCTHTDVGYYDTKAEAIAIYDNLINEWSDKWINNQVDDETYYTNCPDGYEIFSCPYCKKWMINLYY